MTNYIKLWIYRATKYLRASDFCEPVRDKKIPFRIERVKSWPRKFIAPWFMVEMGG